MTTAPRRHGCRSARAAVSGVTIQYADWFSPHQINVRLADRYRVHRVFLAEGTARIHSQEPLPCTHTTSQ